MFSQLQRDSLDGTGGVKEFVLPTGQPTIGFLSPDRDKAMAFPTHASVTATATAKATATATATAAGEGYVRGGEEEGGALLSFFRWTPFWLEV
jgi:hypothetical protein